MAVTLLNTQQRKHRILLSGPPNSGKTFSLNTFKDEGFIKVISMPDEKGIESLPVAENIQNFVFTYDNLPDEVSTKDILDREREKHRDVLTLTRQILKGEYGKTDILVTDGLLKFYENCLGVLTSGRFTKGDPFEMSGSYTTRLFGSAHQIFRNYLSELYYSEIPIVIGTTWVKYDFEEQNVSDDTKRNEMKTGGQKLFPHLPGQMRRDITGEFNISIYCTEEMFTKCTSCQVAKKNNIEYPKETHKVWQIQPSGDALFPGIKDNRINKRYPTFIHPDWKILKSLIERS